MDIEEQRDRLYQIAASDPNPARRAEARLRLQRLPSKSADTGKAPVNLNAGTHDPGPIAMQPGQEVNLASRINALGPSADTNKAIYQTLGRVASGATGGASDALLDAGAGVAGQPRFFREGREQFDSEHPFGSRLAASAGAVIPGSVPARVAGAVEKGVGSAVESLSPKLQALIGPALRRIAGGAAAGGAIGAGQGALTAEPGSRLEAAKSGGLTGAAVGAGLSGAGVVAKKAASGLRDEGLALLEKYGLRPSMIPGVPVAREGASIGEAIREPPLGTHTAGPETRQAAGIRAAQTILPDLLARAKANSAQIADERAGNLLSGVSSRPMSYDRAVQEAARLHDEPGALPAVRSSIGTVANRLIERAAPKVSGLPGPGATLPAGDLQQIASMSHDLAEPEAYGSPGKPALKLLGGRLHAQLPPEMLDQDARFADSAKNLERARESLSLEHGDLKNPEGDVPLAATRRAGNLLGRTGEGTKAAATADLGVSRLREEGPPEVMKGPGGHPSPHAPIQVDYSSAIDQPALHVSQEDLQLNPSAVFSGAGVKGFAHRLGGAGARRLLYVPLRDLGNSEVGRATPPILHLVDALRLRMKQDEEP